MRMRIKSLKNSSPAEGQDQGQWTAQKEHVTNLKVKEMFAPRSGLAETQNSAR